MFNFCNEKVTFSVFMSKMQIYQYLIMNSQNPLFQKFHLLKKSLTKLKLIFCGKLQIDSYFNISDDKKYFTTSFLLCWATGECYLLQK